MANLTKGTFSTPLSFTSFNIFHPHHKVSFPKAIFNHRANPYSPLHNAGSISVSSPKPVITTTIISDETRKCADVIIEALEREGVNHVFANPRGASLEIHQALTRSQTVRTIIPRHEQGGVFAAEGYARASGKVGVCIATSGPGATDIVSGLADALFNSIPLVAITGHVTRGITGTDACQETPMVDVTKSITKHNYLVLDAEDVPRIVKEAFFIAKSGQPGPVLIDIPKDVQQQLVVPEWGKPMKLSSYVSRLPKAPAVSYLKQIVELISESKKPVLYVGGGCVDSSKELSRFVELTGIPVASTSTGLGNYSCGDEFSLGVHGMHGTVCANYAVDSADLLLAFGVRFDDRFASRAKIVQIDIDAAEIGKYKQPHVSICADINLALMGINSLLQKKPNPRPDFSPWREELQGVNKKQTLSSKTSEEAIPPEYAIQVLNELTDGRAIVSAGVRQPHMCAAQWYKIKYSRHWVTSSGLGAMGFGLPSAIGAAVAKPDAIVVDIDDAESFIMNCQELATSRIYNFPIKIIILNNHHLGMAVQSEDRYYKGGNPENESDIFPDMVKLAEAFQIPGARVIRKSEVSDAIRKMLATPGPYLLDVIVPRQTTFYL